MFTLRIWQQHIDHKHLKVWCWTCCSIDICATYYTFSHDNLMSWNWHQLSAYSCNRDRLLSYDRKHTIDQLILHLHIMSSWSVHTKANYEYWFWLFPSLLIVGLHILSYNKSEYLVLICISPHVVMIQQVLSFWIFVWFDLIFLDS